MIRMFCFSIHECHIRLILLKVYLSACEIDEVNHPCFIHAFLCDLAHGLFIRCVFLKQTFCFIYIL